MANKTYYVFTFILFHTKTILSCFKWYTKVRYSCILIHIRIRFSRSNYNLKSSPKSIVDNPDQRITQDSDSLCRSLSSIIPLILISPVKIVFYTYRTWQITGYYGPLGVLIYFVLWTGINKLFISAVSRTIFQQNIFEGNFRFLHTQIRIYNEAIAFYNGGTFEHTRFNNFFNSTLSPILYRRARQDFFLSLSTSLYNYIGSIITYLLLALAIFVFHFYDHLTLSELVQKISQTAGIIGYLIFSFNELNDLADELTLIAANTHRVESFAEYMKHTDQTWSEKPLQILMEQDEVLIIKNLSYSAPNDHKHILTKDLNLTLKQGQRLLITGSFFHLFKFLYLKVSISR